ncbi:hypothetical protein DY000_02001474 [Brassica cretica]|uniref:Uncharacterized protein n=1 Tax=Brassica cretica TaxID=69181 RepID=A0ABQ7CGQ8_BRACR|nr:hypothetical protein DY000_02001474 [Brassica cretica]
MAIKYGGKYVDSFLKGMKQSAITSKIPATKRSPERFLFNVKAILRTTHEAPTSGWVRHDCTLISLQNLNGFIVTECCEPFM